MCMVFDLCILTAILKQTCLGLEVYVYGSFSLLFSLLSENITIMLINLKITENGKIKRQHDMLLTSTLGRRFSYNLQSYYPISLALGN